MPAGKIYLAAKARKTRKYRKGRARLYRRVLSKQPMVNVTRTWWSQNWVPAVTNTTDFWKYLSISISSIPNVSEYTNLFDAYKVNSLTFTLRPRYDNFAGNDTTDTTLPGVTNQGGNQVHVIIDPKSPVTPSGAYSSANLNSFLENGKVKTYMGHNPIKIHVKYPCLADDVNASTNSIFRRCPYISTAVPGAVIRGAHVFIQDVNFTGVFGQSYDLFVTANVTFKGMR